MQNFDIRPIKVISLLNYIQNGEIAIPEIQRPFVWQKKQVRDLIDSLYKGYPVGYLITWQNPSVKLKDGTSAHGKKILIDGQQRVTALMTSILGIQVLDDEYNETVVKIAFNPLAEDDEEVFQVQDSSHLKSNKWIKDISVVFSPNFKRRKFVDDYCANNPEISTDEMDNIIDKLNQITLQELGVIELSPSLDIDTVTGIFIRINTKGTKLSQADFAMSKIAADEKYGGNNLRKAIDYFCHFAVEPGFYNFIKEHDKKFMETDFAKKMAWLKDDYSDIYDPSYDDMLRVSFIHMFGRGKLKDLVSKLSGRDFETKMFTEEVAEESFRQLSEGVINFMKQYNFEQFVLALKNAGFISNKLINSQMALDFAYVVFLQLIQTNEVSKVEIKSYVAKWYVMSTLTGRYSGSPESIMDKDIRNIKQKGVAQYLSEIEAAELSDTFWEVGLVQRLETSAINSPYFSAFTAAQIRSGDKSLFSSGSSIGTLIGVSDVHHIFPKAYLRKIGGIEDKSIYNQIANYTYLDTPVNIAVGEKAPNEYIKKALCDSEQEGRVYGSSMTREELNKNLEENCIPTDIVNWDTNDYIEKFLPERRKLMAQRVKDYYKKL
jgi:hypothetical protein